MIINDPRVQTHFYEAFLEATTYFNHQQTNKFDDSDIISFIDEWLFENYNINDREGVETLFNDIRRPEY